jgi:hypothetical protein
MQAVPGDRCLRTDEGSFARVSVRDIGLVPISEVLKRASGVRT